MSNHAGEGIAGRIESLTDRLHTVRASRNGDIVITLTGSESGQYLLEMSPGSVNVSATAGRTDHPPMLEVVADADTLRAVLDGEVDAREQYFRGGLRVRGNLRYLSDLAMELGILRRPL